LGHEKRHWAIAGVKGHHHHHHVFIDSWQYATAQATGIYGIQVTQLYKKYAINQNMTAVMTHSCKTQYSGVKVGSGKVEYECKGWQRSHSVYNSYRRHVGGILRSVTS